MRVHLTYPRADGSETELPWVLGVLADFRADGAGRWDERAFVDVTREGFDDVLATMRPELRLDTTIGSVTLHFAELDDFRPEAIVRQLPALQPLIDGDDAALGRHLDAILHHPRFQALEAAWRGLWLLVSRTDDDDDARVQIRALDLSKDELRKDLARAPTVDRSRLFQKLWEEIWGVADAVPFGAVVGDYTFDQSDEDRVLLERIAEVAAAANTPFLAAAAPGLIGLDQWKGLENRRTFDAPSAAWQAFRDSDAARYVVLTTPRVLLRAPYGPLGVEVEDFDYRERVGDDGAGYLWGNAAFALAANLNRAFARFGWGAQIRGVEAGGFLQDLPVDFVRAATGEMTLVGPVEVQIDERQEHTLGELGLARLVQMKGAPSAVFFSVPSFHASRAPLAHETAASHTRQLRSSGACGPRRSSRTCSRLGAWRTPSWRWCATPAACGGRARRRRG